MNIHGIYDLPEQPCKTETIPNCAIDDFIVYDSDTNQTTEDSIIESEYIEISQNVIDPNTRRQYRKSYKFNFGKFLLYVIDSLKALSQNIGQEYLTEDDARGLFVLRSGDTMSGPLTIKIDSTDIEGLSQTNQAALYITGPENTNLYHSIQIDKDIIAMSGSFSSGITVATDKLTTTPNGISINNLTTETLSCTSNATIDGTLNIKHKAEFQSDKITLKLPTECSDDASLTCKSTFTAEDRSTFNSDVDLNGDTTVTTDGTFTVNGSINIASGGEINFNAASGSSAATISNSSGTVCITKGKMDELIVGNEDTTAATDEVLKVYGSIKASTTNAKASFYTATVNGTFSATNLSATSEVIAGSKIKISGHDTCYIDSNGFNQTGSAANLTAIAAYWA